MLQTYLTYLTYLTYQHPTILNVKGRKPLGKLIARKVSRFEIPEWVIGTGEPKTECAK